MPVLMRRTHSIVPFAMRAVPSVRYRSNLTQRKAFDNFIVRLCSGSLKEAYHFPTDSSPSLVRSNLIRLAHRARLGGAIFLDVSMLMAGIGLVLYTFNSTVGPKLVQLYNRLD